VLDLVWKSHNSPLFGAALELWVAARTDPELRAAMVQVEQDVASAVWEGAEQLFGVEVATRPGFVPNVDTALNGMRGLALVAIVLDDPAVVERRWEVLRERLLLLFRSDVPQQRRARGRAA